MTEIKVNGIYAKDYDEVVSEVMNQLTTGKDKHGEGFIGAAYIDWGITGPMYKNCSSKSVADAVALTFKEYGYFVYVQRMGKGSACIPEGTPVCYRVYSQARNDCKWDQL